MGFSTIDQFNANSPREPVKEIRKSVNLMIIL